MSDAVCPHRAHIPRSWTVAVAWVTTRSADTGANRFQGRYRDPFGRKQAAGTFSTRRAALKAALQAEGTVENGTWVDPRAGRITFREYAEETGFLPVTSS